MQIDRIESIDFIRFLAIIAVISIHSSPFQTDSTLSFKYYPYFDVFINQLSRFAVPFFFVISGYFFGIKIKSGAQPFRTCLIMSNRILFVFLFWCLIYILPYNINIYFDYGFVVAIKKSYWNITNLLHTPLILLFVGTKGHLWFLIALLSSLIISTFFIKYKRIKTLYIISVSLYIFGIIANSYSNTPIGINLEFNTRNGPFFGTVLFATGIYLSQKQVSIKWLYHGIFVALLGAMMHFVEIYLLWSMYGTPLKQDYVIGTYFMGLGTAMVALSNHSALRARALSSAGKMALGIYAVHYVFIDILKPFDEKTNTVLWELSYVFIVFSLSYITVKVLANFSLTKKTVL